LLGFTRKQVTITHLLFRVGRLLPVLLAAACAATSPRVLPDIPQLVGQPVPEAPDVDWLALSPGMKAFVERHAKSTDRHRGKAWSLAYAAMDPYILNFKYDPQLTLPADETFEKGVGNCLSFSSMFVAMAREAGITAYFQEVELPPNWSNVDDNLLFGKHINAVVVEDGYSFTVDVSGRVRREVERTRRLSDAEAEALFYNNLAVDALIEKDNPLAYSYLRKALHTGPRLDYIWANLGVVLRRNGQTEDAVLAYRTALRLESDQTVALNNLHVIYTEDGNLEAAAEIESRVEKTRRKNPYYIQQLAEMAIEEQRYEDAIGLARKAVKMDADEYRFYETLARSQYLAGKTEAALDSLEEARQRAPDLKTRDSLVLPAEEF